jgi:hypothetical protein
MNNSYNIGQSKNFVGFEQRPVYSIESLDEDFSFAELIFQQEVQAMDEIKRKSRQSHAKRKLRNKCRTTNGAKLLSLKIPRNKSC